jgi:DNA primase catalytic core
VARVPEAELARIKREVRVEDLARARGVKLTRRGQDLVGLCPFHDDREPSLIVSPAKNLWHCLGACQAGGSVIDWVMRDRGISFRRAVELLRSDLPPEAVVEERPDEPVLPSPVVADAEDAEVLDQVVGFYQETLQDSPEALAYLAARGLDHPELLLRFRLGYANRTLGYRLPSKKLKAGREIRGRLQALGVLRESGHEHFNGSLVVPVFGEGGRVVEIYGRKIGERLRKGTPLHLYLPGPHRGVWNAGGLRDRGEVILCESLLDALTFWSAGFENVTAAYGVNGWTEEHLAVFRQARVERVLVAYDRDEAGDRGAARLAEKLLAEGMAPYRVLFPRGMDANEYALKVKPAAKSLDLALRRAEWMGQGEAPARRAVALPPSPPAAPPEPAAKEDGEAVGPSAPAPEPPATRACAPPPDPSSLAAGGEGEPPSAAPEPAERSATLLPAPPAPELPVVVSEREVSITLGDRRYRVRGLAKNLSYDVLKVNLLASRSGAGGEGFHVDTLDLYSARQRAAFLKQAALELGVEPRVAKQDLGAVLLKLEELQDEQIRAALSPAEPAAVALTKAEEAEALELLRDPRLLERILEDFHACGVVGEETNKLVGYLATVSRRQARPLAVLIQSSSAAGKSALMEAVLAFVPEEERVSYSAMTGQSLFYMGETSLKHKVLAVVEEEGAERASYALKLLQSEGELTIASTGKDPSSGKLVTHEYRVEGPVALLLTTTAIDVDEELLNRCLVLTVDEGREQTRAIHRVQRERETLAGQMRLRGRERVLAVHRNAQRLLQPLMVVNPWAEGLRFPDECTRTRRDHEKYLGLIRAVALLHQHQRELREGWGGGERVAYLEVSVADIEVANRLAHEVLGRSLDELPPQTRRLLLLLEEWVSGECERQGIDREVFRFTRRAVREALGWGHTQLKIHLARLVELEYLVLHASGHAQRHVYELLYAGEGQDGRPFLPGLIDVAKLRKAGRAEGTTTNRSGPEANRSGQDANRSGLGRPLVGPRSGGGRGGVSPAESTTSAAIRPESPETAHRGVSEKPSSYRTPGRRSPGSPVAAPPGAGGR